MSPTLLQAAVAHHRAGRLGEAKDLYVRVLTANPNDVDALHLFGALAHDLGHDDVAVEFIGRAIALDPAVAHYHYNLAQAQRARGDLTAAAKGYAEAVRLDPGWADAHNNLGIALRGTGDPEREAACYAEAVRLQPSHAGAWINLGNVLQERDGLDDALACYETALRLDPGNAMARTNLGGALQSLGRVDEAVACYDEVLRHHPDHASALYNLGQSRMAQGRTVEATACYEQALRQSPDDPDTHWSLGLCLLTRGDYARGWQEFEWGRRTPARLAEARRFAQAPWTGDDIRGRTILLHAEQGLGDTLQFIRYAALVKALGATVVVETQPELVRLCKGMDGVDHLAGQGETLPPFDCHAPMLSLPGLLGTTVATIPATVPYLAAPADDTVRWAERLGPYVGRKVGLAWAGNPRRFQKDANAIDRRRSMALHQFAPLASIAGVHFLSLQKGEPADQARSPPPGLVLVDFMDDVTDFADTAALVANLDLVIGVDTSVVHLAGALGKPVWILSRFDGCWRWLKDRDDSPWYPTARLFRQPHPGAWAPVVETVAEALREWGG